MKPHSFFGLLAISALALLPGPLPGAEILSDDFESGTFAGRWDETFDSEIFTDGGAGGSANYAVLSGTNGLMGVAFDEPEGNFFIEFNLRVVDTAARQFNIMVSTQQFVSDGGASINLRYQGSWAAFGGGWQPLADLDPLGSFSWHRVRITCRGWGSAGATYDVELSDPDGTEFTSSVKGLSFYQGGNPDSEAAGSVSFVTTWGVTQGFDIDDVVVETIDIIVEDDPNIFVDNANPFQLVELEPNPDPVVVDLVVENTGLENDLVIRDTTAFAGESAENFSVVTPLPATVPPLSTTILQLQFEAPAGGVGQYGSTLSLVSNDPSNGTLAIPCSVVVPSEDGNQLGNWNFEDSSEELVRWLRNPDPSLAASPEAGFAPDSATAARVWAGETLGQNPVSQGTWYTDFYFQTEDTGARSLNVVLSYAGGELNIQCLGAGEFAVWNAYTEEDMWGDPIEGLPGVEPYTTYRMRIAGRDWDGIDPVYDISLSEPDGTEFVHTATGLFRFRGGIPSGGPSLLSFTARWGGSPGFLIDDARFINGAPDGGPLEPVSPVITGFDYDRLAQTATIEWTTEVGTPYVVQASPNLAGGSWVQIGSGTATAETATHSEENVSDPTRHYRVMNSQ